MYPTHKFQYTYDETKHYDKQPKELMKHPTTFNITVNLKYR